MQKTNKKIVLSAQEEEEGLKTPTKERKAAQSVVTPDRRRRGATEPELAKAIDLSDDINVVTPVDTAKSRALTPNRTVEIVEPTSLKKEFQKESMEKVGVKASTLHIAKEVEKCYKIVRKATGALGGNGHTGALISYLIVHFWVNYYRDLCRCYLRRTNNAQHAEGSQLSR